MEEKIKEIIIKHLTDIDFPSGTREYFAGLISKEIASLIQPSQVISEEEIMPILNKIAISKGFECFDQAQVILNREKLHELYFEGFKKCLSLTQSDAVDLLEWSHAFSPYTLVICQDSGKMAWVDSIKHEIYVHGNEDYKNRLIENYGISTKAVLRKYKLFKQKQNG